MTIAQEQLLAQLNDPVQKVAAASRFGTHIKDRLRETSFMESIVPSETITPSDCQVSTNHDTLVRIEHLAPKSRAAVMSFRGSPEANFLRGERIEVPFITIMSDMFQKPEQEFLVYPYPLGKLVEDQSVKDIGEVQDREWLIYSEASVQAHQAEANGGTATALNATGLAASSVLENSIVKGEIARVQTANTAVVHPCQRRDVIRLMNILDGRRLKTELLLFTETDWNNILSWTVEDAGSPNQSATMYEGIKSNTLLGKRYVRTIKTDILRPGNVYAYTSPEFLGRNYVLNNVKFYIDKVINIIKFVAWKDVAMTIANTASVAKLELYSGDAATNADGILASVSPVPENALGAENNRAGNRQFFPSTVSF